MGTAYVHLMEITSFQQPALLNLCWCNRNSFALCKMAKIFYEVFFLHLYHNSQVYTLKASIEKNIYCVA